MANYTKVGTSITISECQLYNVLLSGCGCNSNARWINDETEVVKTGKQWLNIFIATPPSCTDAGGTVTNVSSANDDIDVATGTTTPVLTAVQTPALRSATTTVNVSSATEPTAGQVLTATSNTAATWQDLPTTPTLASGTYTPTISKTLNVSTSTARDLTYMRVGNTVTVAGQCDITATGSGLTTASFTLPIASDFSTAYQAGGAGGGLTGTGSFVATFQSNATSNKVDLTYMAPSGASLTITFTFTYQIL